MIKHVLRNNDGTRHFRDDFQPVTLIQSTGKNWLNMSEANAVIRTAMIENMWNIVNRRCVIRTIRWKTNH